MYKGAKNILINPLTKWFLWYIRTQKLLKNNRNKNLHIGYLTTIANTKLGVYNTFYNNVRISNSIISDFVYIAESTQISNTSIGKFCSIGPSVKIGLGMHPTNFISTFPAFFSTNKQCQITFVERNYFEEIGKIIIGNDVWIGARATILDNINIGDGAIIAAGSVVTKNIPPYTVVGGIPAKEIKKRFDSNKIEELLKLKWWNKDINWIKNNAKLFNNPEMFFTKN